MSERVALVRKWFDLQNFGTDIQVDDFKYLIFTMGIVPVYLQGDIVRHKPA